jgi:transcription elongation factor Elf1
MNKHLFDKLVKRGTISRQKSSDKSHFLTCPSCQNHLLKHDATKNGPVCICFQCGNFFYASTEKQIKQLTGNANLWLDEVADEINVIDSYMSPYKTETLEERKEEFVEYLSKEIHHGHRLPAELDDHNLFNIFSTCDTCGEKFYADSFLNQALLEYDYPERTSDILQEQFSEHELMHSEEVKYKEVIFNESTWYAKNRDKFDFLKVRCSLRKKIALVICQMYSEWVLEGPTFNVNYDKDPEWDCSGELEFVNTGKSDRLLSFEFLGEWLYSCYTGESFDVHEPGREVRHITYDFDVFELISETLEEEFLKGMNSKQIEDFFAGDGPDEMYELEDQMMKFICTIPALQAWNWTKSLAQDSIDKVNQINAEYKEKYEENKQITQKIWQENFSGMKKITKANSSVFFDKLKDVLAKSDQKIVEAIKQVSLPCAFTKKTKNVFDQTVNEFLTKFSKPKN